LSLIDLICRGKYQTVSVVGIAKNTGKTTTLNHIVKEAAAKEIDLGLTSIGRDGEKTDTVTRLPKPPVYAPRGTVVATAEDALRESQAQLEILAPTEFVTQLGRIMIARVREAGHVVLVGPNHAREMVAVIEQLQYHGCDLVLADGAFDRVAAAAPSVTEATILATGAFLDPSLEATVERTALTIWQFNLRPPRDQAVLAAATAAIADRCVGLIDDAGAFHDLGMKTALERGDDIRAAAGPQTRGIVISGSLVGSVLEDLMRDAALIKRARIIVRDGTRVFISPATWRRFVNMGGQLRVIEPIHLLALTVNPYSPVGPSYDPRVFLERIGNVAKPLPTYDLILGQSVNTK